METTRPGSEGREDSLFGAIALLSGGSFLFHLGVVAALPSANSYQEVAVYKAHQTVFVLLLISILLFTMFGVAFSAGLGRVLAPYSSAVAAGASATLAMGILIIGLAIVLSIGALGAISQLPADSSYTSSASFEGAFWASLQGTMNSFGDGLMGLGLLLFGLVAWRSSAVPKWLAVIGLIGGVGGFLAIVADPLAIVSFGAFTVWSIAVGVLLLRGSMKKETAVAR